MGASRWLITYHTKWMGLIKNKSVVIEADTSLGALAHFYELNKIMGKPRPRYAKIRKTQEDRGG